jgi:hypothetical protein
MIGTVCLAHESDLGPRRRHCEEPKATRQSDWIACFASLVSQRGGRSARGGDRGAAADRSAACCGRMDRATGGDAGTNNGPPKTRPQAEAGVISIVSPYL